MSILDLLRAKRPTADSLSEALARAEAEISEAETEAATLSAARTDALLRDDGDAELDRIEAALTRAQRRGDRAALVAGELRGRLELARIEARRAAERAELKAAEDAGRRAHELTMTKYVAAAEALAAVLDEIKALDAKVHAVNAKIAAGGLMEPPPASIKDSAGHVEFPEIVRCYMRPVWQRIAELPHPERVGGVVDSGAPIWPRPAG
ncbi:hypothetical protein [Rhodocista pekingensis]|uniref:Uncharacterized protein n=1 Tax=Rhodocista pekingensis TaxID=201185 RepID=A0ABW2KUM8_9PROT